MKPGEIVERAMVIAIEAHAGQTDKNGEPYIKHPMRVAKSAPAGDYEAQAVALLHDVIEDSMWDAASLRLEGLPVNIVEAVVAITHLRHESYANYLMRVKKNPLARQTKLLDIADNTDPERLAQLDQETQDRLKLKYTEAVRFLTT